MLKLFLSVLQAASALIACKYHQVWWYS